MYNIQVERGVNMKKHNLLLLLAFALVGCNLNEDTSSLKIVSPTGAPAIAFYNHSQNENFETNSTPTNIISMMTSSSSKDIVVIDTVSGIKAIEKGAPYKIAANITFGNFYLVATGNDEDKIMSQDDTIILFGQNQTPDLLFHYLYGNEFDSSIEYVSAVSDAAKCLVTGKNLITSSIVDYVFIAQPVLYNVLNNKNASTYQKAYVYKNIQEEYSKTTNNMSLVQASVFVKNDSDQRLIKSFLNQLENDIENAIKDPNVVKESMDKISKEEATSLFGINSDVAKLVLEDNNGIGLGYKKASENKKDIDKYISLFGLNETNKEIYFK